MRKHFNFRKRLSLKRFRERQPVRTDEHDRIRASLAKAPGILARPVELEPGMGMFDHGDAQTARPQERNEFFYKRGLAAVRAGCNE